MVIIITGQVDFFNWLVDRSNTLSNDKNINAGIWLFALNNF
jgi:hypothetical protein